MSGQDANLRASDADRADVADQLQAHCAAGRISVDELDERVGRAMSARTYGELAELTADLPALQTGPSPAATPSFELEPVVVRGHGIRPFTMRVEVHAPPERARALALETIAPGLNTMRFAITNQSPTMLEFERSGDRTIAIVIAVMLFPIGLLALARRREQRVTIAIEQVPGNRTAIIIHGNASRKVRAEFARLRF
jgi:hypothetical protein